MASETKTAAKSKRRPTYQDWQKLCLKYHVWEVLAFVLPFILIGIGFWKQKIHPFGDQQFLVTDLWHQYYPFFQVLQEKLQGGGSLLYSWRTGMGTNWLSLMSYYCASPLNLLVFFIPKESARTGMMVILMLKFSCAGGFMAQCLRYVFKKNDPSITMFGIMYAMCSYMVGYYWNTIWIDSVALLPLVMLGLTALVREGKYRVYVISLALAMISSYYIGYMICIYVVITFFVLCIFEGTKPKRFLKRFLKVTGVSVLSGGLTAWLLLPAYFGLQMTHSATNTFPTTTKWYEAWGDILSNMLAFTEVTSKEGLPNLYCGLLAVLLIGVFLIAKKIRLREKIAGVLLLVFLLISCNLNTLNFMWHGFHVPNMLPYRFSFLFSFTLLIIAYRAYQILLEEKLNFVQWGSMIAVAGIFLYLAYRSGIQEEEHKFVLYNAILGGVYLVVILLRRFTPKQVVQGAMMAVLLFEMGAQSINGVKSVGSSSYTSYPANKEEIPQLLSIRDQRDDELFSRTELTMWYTLNDPALYRFDGLSQFSSMANEKVTTFMRKIGVPAGEASNRYFYGNNTPVVNLLCDIKYIMAKDGFIGDTLNTSQIGESNSSALFRETHQPSLGYLSNPAVTMYPMDDTLNPFEQQNGIFRAMTDMDEDVFSPIDIIHVGHVGYEVIRNGYGDYNYTRNEDAPEDSFLKYNYVAEHDGMMYALVKVKDAEEAHIYYGEEKIHTYNIGRQEYTFPLGNMKKGEMVRIRVPMKEDNESGTVKIFVYELHQDVLEEGYKRLNEGRLELTEFADTHFKGTVSADSGKTLYMSVPYEEGWKVYVDGQKSDLFPLFGGMCGVNLTEGTHEIEMRYSPQGFIPGLCVTVVSLAILVLLYLKERKDRLKAEQETEPEEPEPSAEEESEEKSDGEVSDESDESDESDSVQVPVSDDSSEETAEPVGEE
ncbi:MAG: YfhO family protein [Oscillospiraceae bacterium]|nr:YfhO family protein [Oscillospiraceae bacterium]